MKRRIGYMRVAAGLVVLVIVLCGLRFCLNDPRWDSLLPALIGGVLSAAAAVFGTGLAIEGTSAQSREEIRIEREETRQAKLAALRAEIAENCLLLKRKKEKEELQISEWAPLSDSAWGEAKGCLVPSDLATVTQAYVWVRKYNRALETYLASKVARGGGMGQVPIQETRDALLEAAKVLGIDA